MRLVFISSVTAMTPLRTISVTTGSGRRALAGLRLVFFFAIVFTHILSSVPTAVGTPPISALRYSAALATRGLSGLSAASRGATSAMKRSMERQRCSSVPQSLP